MDAQAYVYAVLCFWVPLVLWHVVKKKSYTHLFYLGALCYVIGSLFTFLVNPNIGFIAVVLIQTSLLVVMLYALFFRK